MWYTVYKEFCLLKNECNAMINHIIWLFFLYTCTPCNRNFLSRINDLIYPDYFSKINDQSYNLTVSRINDQIYSDYFSKINDQSFTLTISSWRNEKATFKEKEIQVSGEKVIIIIFIIIIIIIFFNIIIIFIFIFIFIITFIFIIMRSW